MIERQWYKLAGESEQAMREIVSLSQATKEPINLDNHKTLFEKIGFFHGSGRSFTEGGAGLFYPDIFATEDGFYLAAPLGISAADIRARKDRLTHFEPPGAEKLDEAQTTALMSELFHGGWGDAAPILSREPVLSPNTRQPMPQPC